MALRARLAAPPLQPKVLWPWHTLKWASVSVRQIIGGERRMEAATYLSHGFSLRESIKRRSTGWVPFWELAKVSQPGRLKGILVSHEYGTPFLTATQVFDVRPVPRKFLALGKMGTATECFVDDGTILVTRSGSVGRPTLAHAPHRGVVISDDLLRISAKDKRYYGWLYAYLHAPQVRAMAIGAHYGHIIKHLETSHLEALPIPTVDDATATDFARRVGRILELRNEGYRLTLAAEACFEEALGPLEITDWGEQGFSVKASMCLRGRRRFDASFHNPGIAIIRRHLAKRGKGFTTVSDAGYDVWVPGRYKRIPAEDGVVYRDSADLLEVSPDLMKRFADCRFGDEFRGRVKSGWILIPSSGQVYGIMGTAILATAALNDQVVSNHVIRVAPQECASIRAGYLVTAMSHLTWGRPLIKSLAFGSSVPEIDSDDLANLEIVRLNPAEESAIADMAEASAEARAEADLLEHNIGQDAGAIIEQFMAGP
jgi:type I restriction enzyme S subunit